MAQFDVYKNTNSKTKYEIPYFVDVQHDVANDLNTRLVIPIYSNIKALKKLNVSCKINGKTLTILTNKMTSIPKHLLEEKVTDLKQYRDEIIASIDFLTTGF